MPFAASNTWSRGVDEKYIRKQILINQVLFWRGVWRVNCHDRLAVHDISEMFMKCGFF